jgi:DNA-binding GntR family transcriptional regulator
MHMRASEVAYLRLREEIIQWHLRPGMPLGEIETAQRMGVSRTPIREALSRLAAEGLVANGPGRTMVVAPLSQETIRHIYAYRDAFLAGPGDGDVVDNETPYFLADRLDLAIDDATGNPYLVNALRDLRGHLARVRRHAKLDPSRLVAATAEHLLIVEAILAQDEMLAMRATGVHLFNSMNNILATATNISESSESSESSEGGDAGGVDGVAAGAVSAVSAVAPSAAPAASGGTAAQGVAAASAPEGVS